MPEHADQPALPEVDDADRVVGLIARLPHGSTVRRLALQVLQGRRMESVQPLYSSLMTPRVSHWRERQAAAWALGRTELSTEDRAAVLEKLLDLLEGGHREPVSMRLKRSLFIAGIATVATFIGACMLFGPPGPDFTEAIPFLVGFYCFLGAVTLPTIFWEERLTTNRVRAAVADALGKMGSVEAVGTLAAKLQDGSEEVRSASAAALHALLPLVTPEHYGMLGAESMQTLGKALFHPDGQLVFKVLTALENAGTSLAIPWVERAAQRGRTVRVRDAAAHVLEVLQLRRAREMDRDRLLRPTNGLHDPALLLRAQTSNSDDSAFLLQPSSESS